MKKEDSIKERKAIQKVFQMNSKQFREHIEEKREEFEKYIDDERERERKTMERGQLYWINT